MSLITTLVEAAWSYGAGRFCVATLEKPSRVGSPNPAKNFGLVG